MWGGAGPARQLRTGPRRPKCLHPAYQRAELHHPKSGRRPPSFQGGREGSLRLFGREFGSQLADLELVAQRKDPGLSIRESWVRIPPGPPEARAETRIPPFAAAFSVPAESKSAHLSALQAGGFVTPRGNEGRTVSIRSKIPESSNLKFP